MPTLLAALVFVVALGAAPCGFAEGTSPAPSAGAPAAPAADPNPTDKKTPDKKPELKGMAKTIYQETRKFSADGRKKDLADSDKEIKAMVAKGKPKEWIEIMESAREFERDMYGTCDAMDAAKAAKDEAKFAVLEEKLRGQAIAFAAYVAKSQKKMVKMIDRTKPLAVGSAAPALEARIVSGDAVSLKFADHPGKPVVVDFWGTQCAPCRESIPHLDALWAEYKDKAVFVGITHEPEDDVKKFVAAQKAMRYPVAVEVGKIGQAYRVTGIPQAFLVVDGKVVWEGDPRDGLDKALEKALAKAAPVADSAKDASVEADPKK